MNSMAWSLSFNDSPEFRFWSVGAMNESLSWSLRDSSEFFLWVKAQRRIPWVVAPSYHSKFNGFKEIFRLSNSSQELVLHDRCLNFQSSSELNGPVPPFFITMGHNTFFSLRPKPKDTKITQDQYYDIPSTLLLFSKYTSVFICWKSKRSVHRHWQIQFHWIH